MCFPKLAHELTKGLAERSTKDIHERILIRDKYYTDWNVARFGICIL